MFRIQPTYLVRNRNHQCFCTIPVNKERQGIIDLARYVLSKTKSRLLRVVLNGAEAMTPGIIVFFIINIVAAVVLFFFNKMLTNIIGVILLLEVVVYFSYIKIKNKYKIKKE